MLESLNNSECKKSTSSLTGTEWAEYFKNLNKKPVTSCHNILELLHDMEKEKVFTELDFAITEKEIVDAIHSLKNKKACGPDSIINEMIKASQSFLIKSLKKAFNLILSLGNYPKLWAEGYIIPIFKNGSKDDPNNYRGLTVNSCLSKVFTKILNKRLENFCVKRNFICPEQIGFCKGKRTSDHMFVLKCLIEKYTQSGSKRLYSCFIDFKKAFDKVWHEGLFYKLRKLGVSDLFYNLIKNMYSKTQLSVKVDSCHLTDNFSSFIGVRQGDNLSPLLYNIFVNDIPDTFDTDCCPVSLGTKTLNCLMYADDLILLSESAEGLQESLNKLQVYCNNWGLEVNIKKTKTLIFNNTGKLIPKQFYLNNVPLDNEKTYSYLGVNFNINGNFTDAKQELYNKGLKALFKFKKCFSGQLPKIKTLLHVFDHTVKPVLLYGCEIWAELNSNKLNAQGDRYFKKLCENLVVEKAHISFCKFILGVPRRATNIAVMGELGRYPLFLEILLNMFKYSIRLYKTEDVLLQQAFSLSKSLNETHKKKSWYSDIHSLFQYFDINEQYMLTLKTKLKTYLLKKLHIKYNSIWHAELCNDDRGNKLYGNKLRTFRLFKNRICLEKYLSLDFSYRNVITKFRISAHRLEIERGRYKNQEVSERICRLCGTEVEDEIHFLLQCSKLATVRENFLHEINRLCKNFKNLDTKSQFIWLMSSEDSSLLQKLGELLIKLLSYKNNLLPVEAKDAQ